MSSRFRSAHEEALRWSPFNERHPSQQVKKLFMWPLSYALSFLLEIVHPNQPQSTVSLEPEPREALATGPKGFDPPVDAEFLFYLFMTPQNCDALVGDLEERYKLIHKKFGRRRANFWYWTQTVMSLGPIVWAWGKKVSMKPVLALIGWAVAKGLVGHDSWLAALVELWKRVRS